jgi:hypothetical protein
MHSKTTAELYETMEPEAQLKHLLRLSFNLTVVARNTYAAGANDVDRPKALRGIVEICHKVLGRIQSISNGGFSVPITDFWSSIYAVAEIYDCLFELENAVAFSFEGT